MNQLKNIEILKGIFPEMQGIEAALLYGSFGRGEAMPGSDIDIKLLVDDTFDPRVFGRELQEKFGTALIEVREVKKRGKLVAYFYDCPKTEFALCRQLSEIDRDYKGSEITEPERTVLFNNDKMAELLLPYLYNLIEEAKKEKKTEKLREEAEELVDKFVYEFENCSAMHSRSDGYRFFFWYNIAVHAAVQLKHLSKGGLAYNFLPKHFPSQTLSPEEQPHFSELLGTISLLNANSKKRALLDFFYRAGIGIVSEKTMTEAKQLCEKFFERDYWWNLRDLALINPKIKKGLVFRSGTMTLFQENPSFDMLLRDDRIKTIIDLRADREIGKDSYSEQSLKKFDYINAQMDPWAQPQWFKDARPKGSNEEVAYLFFIQGCKEQIQSVFKGVLSQNEGAVLIHCHAGKDRTGIVVSLLHLLLEAPREVVYEDFLASDAGLARRNVDWVLQAVEEQGGIHSFLTGCGLTENELHKLKTKLQDG